MGDRRKAPQQKARMQQRTNKASRPRLIRNICVYCGSNVGANPAYAAAARELGKIMAKDGVGLVYGGGGRGLMGELARAVLTNGGRVTGIIPEFLSAESTCCAMSPISSSSTTCISEKS